MSKGMSREELFRFAAEEYGTKPEYLWESSPDSAVLRHSENAKWYAIVMSVRADRLGLDNSETVDVVNVRCGPIMVGSLLGCEGVFPAYHMNKVSWVSLLLGSSADREQIRSLLRLSYEMTLSAPKSKRRERY